MIGTMKPESRSRPRKAKAAQGGRGKSAPSRPRAARDGGLVAPLAKGSRTAELYEALKQELLDGVFRPDTKLAIDQLAKRFAVSPGAVRESLSRLTSDRLVVSLPQRGFVVAPVSAKDLKDLVAVRIEIELKCLRRSIELGNLEWEGRLLSTWHQLSRTPPKIDGIPNPDWARLHNSFHDELVSACDSAWWLHLRDALFIQAERYRRMVPLQVLLDRDVHREHQNIMDLTLARNADGACKALQEHFEVTGRYLLEFCDLDGEQPAQSGDLAAPESRQQKRMRR